MKLNFRQGIARHQTDVSGNPTFLQRSAADGQFVDLIVSPQPTIVAFAHRDGTYIIEELKTVSKAWGPITTATTYMYWDVNLLNGVLTRGTTVLPPMYTSGEPVNPQVNQHWFDTVNNMFRVWSGTKWQEKVRCFAGYVTSGAVIHPMPIGTQAGLVGDFEAGNIVLDSFNMPLRQSNGTFVTTTSALNVVNLGTVTARLDGAIMSAMAHEEIPKFSLVQIRPGRRMVLARSTDYTTRISGIVVEDLYEGDVARVISTGVVQSPDWAWPDSQMNRPLFCGSTGQVTLTPPSYGVLQQIGFVYDRDAIFLDLKHAVVLDDPNSTIPPNNPPPSTAPIAGFSADVTSGTAPLTVSFTDNSTAATSLEWDFTNDGYVDSTSQNPTYTYSTPGTYTVRQRAINTYGTDEEIKINFIQISAPNLGNLNVNLGLSFSAPSTVQAGQPFSFQVVVSNDGLANATAVTRTIKLRSSNGSDVNIVNPPSGITTTRSGAILIVTLPQVDIASGTFASLTLQAQTDANVTAVQLEGSVSSAQTDPELDDNQASLTIGVRP